MTDRWIITKHRYHQHRTLEDAQIELCRLQAKVPGVEFRILQVANPPQAPSVIPAAAETEAG